MLRPSLWLAVIVITIVVASARPGPPPPAPASPQLKEEQIKMLARRKKMPKKLDEEIAWPEMNEQHGVMLRYRGSKHHQALRRDEIARDPDYVPESSRALWLMEEKAQLFGEVSKTVLAAYRQREEDKRRAEMLLQKCNELLETSRRINRNYLEECLRLSSSSSSLAEKKTKKCDERMQELKDADERYKEAKREFDAIMEMPLDRTVNEIMLLKKKH